jgi:hypothetical protein
VTDSRDEHETYAHTESPIIVALQKQIARLTAERDEARRMICRLHFTSAELQHDFAKAKGWDCFKEDGK